MVGYNLKNFLTVCPNSNCKEVKRHRYACNAK